MSTTTTTGFCRVTVAGPSRRVDLALPCDVPVADLAPDVLRLLDLPVAEGQPVGHHLIRADGSALDPARSLAEQRVLDGSVLVLRPFAESLPPPVHDDVADAVGDAVARDRRAWDDALLRTSGLLAAAVLAALTAPVLWLAEPERHETHGLPGVLAALLTLFLAGFALVRARVYRDNGAAIAMGLASLPHAWVAGTAVFPLAAGHGPGRLEVLLGCVAVLLVAGTLMAAVPGAAAPFTAAAVASGAGALAAFGAIATEAEPVVAAAVCAPVALGALAFLPGLAARLVRLPIGYVAPSNEPETEQAPSEGPVDTERVAEQARRGHQTLLGLTAGCALLALGAAAVLGFSGNGWAQLLALATGVALLTRSRLFRYAVQTGTLLVAGLGCLVLTVLGHSLDAAGSGEGGGPGLSTVWLTLALALLAALFTAVALVVPRAGLTPFWGRVLDLAEGAVLLSLLPLCLAVLELYTAARELTG